MRGRPKPNARRLSRGLGGLVDRHELLDVAGAPTFADAQAAITWSSGVQTQVKVDANLKTLIGRGSGETIQMAFSGEGWVLVQPSEGRVQAAAGGGGGAAGGLGGLLGGR